MENKTTYFLLIIYGNKMSIYKIKYKPQFIQCRLPFLTSYLSFHQYNTKLYHLQLGFNIRGPLTKH